jgi:RHO1 GDP-GTP exchange protein 1/2
MGGLYTLYAESQQVRTDWKKKLDEAIGLRKVVQESNKVFEVETLSTDTFLVPSMMAGVASPSWNHENSFTGKVTCSVPFSVSSHAPWFFWPTDVPPTATADGRGLVAIGCAEGVWIGFRHDPRCEHDSSVLQAGSKTIAIAMRRVLHLKMVTQCAMLEDFGIFLVLADKVYQFQSPSTQTAFLTHFASRCSRITSRP